MSELALVGGLNFPALSSAARNCDVDALRELLSAGVSVDHVCRAGGDELGGGFCLTPLQHVCKSGMNSGGNNIEGRVDCVKLLIEHGACLDAGARGNPGESTDTHPTLTPLMYAAYSGDLDIVKMLISAGSDVNALIPPDRGGSAISTLLMAVISYQAANQNDPKNCDAVIETLLRAGANANPPDMTRTPFMEMAIAHCRRRIWPLLLRAGAILPTGENGYLPSNYHTHRTHPYLRKLDAAGGFKAYAKAHRTKLLATFTPKFAHLVPPELVPLIVEFSFHVGFY